MEFFLSSQFLYVLFAVNILTFIIIGADRHYSKVGKSIVNKGIIFVLALLGGSVGAFFGIYIFDHGRQEKIVKYGILAIYVVQFALGVRFGIL